ncbi:hypothetical protein CDD81_4443 [Ophiocordyceps australis]|uniref:Uncharacterized protein n=1 Tax=Ophiocordyceps australis TaxID=1399860 RepID=A0A2C5XML4_9HYPO|nr:hypothetical protein CDD81_4443 [Ophiocordyceps australis]
MRRVLSEDSSLWACSHGPDFKDMDIAAQESITESNMKNLAVMSDTDLATTARPGAREASTAAKTAQSVSERQRKLKKFGKMASMSEINLLISDLSNESRIVSDWETVAGGEEFYAQSDASSKSSQDSYFEEKKVAKRAVSMRPNSIVIRPDIGGLRARFSTMTKQSLHVPSSIYSDDFKGGFRERVEYFDPDTTRKRPMTVGLHRDASGQLVTSNSQSTNNSGVDRFRYDTGCYSSIFLQPSAERDISRALHKFGMSTETVSMATRPFEGVINAQEHPLPCNGAYYDAVAIPSS